MPQPQIEESIPEPPPLDPKLVTAVAAYDAITEDEWRQINYDALRFSRAFPEEQEVEYSDEAFPLAAFPEVVTMDYSLLSYLDRPGLSRLGFRRYYKENRLRDLF